MSIKDQPRSFSWSDHVATPMAARRGESLDDALAGLVNRARSVAFQWPMATRHERDQMMTALVDQARGMLVAAQARGPSEFAFTQRRLSAGLASAGQLLADPSWKAALARAAMLVSTDLAAAFASNTSSGITAGSTRPNSASANPWSSAAAARPPPNAPVASMRQAKGTADHVAPLLDEAALGAAGHPAEGRLPTSSKMPLSWGAASEHRAALEALGFVDLEVRGKLCRRPFRVSAIVDSEGLAPVLQGSMVASGSFGKIVPVSFVDSRGMLVQAMGKLVRKEAANMYAGKLATDFFGRRRTHVASDEEFEEEMHLQELLGGPVKLLGSRSFENKRMMLLTKMHMSLLDAAQSATPSERASLARDVDLIRFGRHISCIMMHDGAYHGKTEKNELHCVIQSRSC